jgi:uncharacterized protein (TIGR02466 family)
MTHETQVDLVPLFSQPVCISQLEITEEVAKHIRNIEYYEMTSSVGWLSEDTQVLDHPTMVDLKSKLLNRIKGYAHSMLQIQDDIEFYITNSWVTVHKDGDFAPAHNHDNSLISGTLYINIPDDDESLFEIYAPQAHSLFGFLKPKYKDWNIFNSKKWAAKPLTGTTIIFPSTLEHGTTPMTSKTDKRYCLAFNVFVHGDFHDSWQEGKAAINRLVL